MFSSSLQGLFWSKNVKNLDLERDKNYIVHQTLAYGSWNDLKWLFGVYSKEDIKKTFIDNPSKDYFPAAFNFVSSLLGVSVEMSKYDRTSPRNIG